MNIEKFINDCKPEMKNYLHNTNGKLENLIDNELHIVFNDYNNELYINAKNVFQTFYVEEINNVNMSGIDSDSIVKFLSKKIGETISTETIENLIAELYIYEVDANSFYFKSEGILYVVKE